VAHRDTQHWRIEAGGHRLTAGVLVNAAGAWADAVARAAGVQPAAIVPLRRTIVVAAVSPEAPGCMPLVMDVGGTLYFKPDAGRLWISPHDETPDLAHDVQPAEIDVATALHRFGRMCDWPVERVAARWAGLRSFAPDRLPLLGWDANTDGFFWCAGQGGWGIQTAPAASALGAALLLGKPPAIDPAPFDPARAGRTGRAPA
jgi:D-arginine dehydrogenase